MKCICINISPKMIRHNTAHFTIHAAYSVKSQKTSKSIHACMVYQLSLYVITAMPGFVFHP